MKLLIEEARDIRYLKEETSRGPRLTLEGVFLQTKPNKNNRCYSLDIMVPEVNRYIAERVQKNRAWGELGHPSNPSINHDRVSHLIIELKQNGEDFIGKAVVTETPMGKIVQGLIEVGGSLGVSSRGVGSTVVNSKGLMEVQSDFRLCTAADIVDDPSAPDAWVKSIMENREWYFDKFAGEWRSQEVVDNQVKEIKSASKTFIKENSALMFERFMIELIKQKKT